MTESAIRRAASNGVRSLRDLSAQTGCSTGCGRCVHTARETLDQALAEIGSPAAMVELEVVASS